MDIIKKRITVPILVLLLIFVSLSQIPATFGKYVSDTQTGTLWESIFEGASVDYSDIFFITEPGKSANLHGFDVKDEYGNIINPKGYPVQDKDGNLVDADVYYDLTKDLLVSFPVYNGSSDYMLICFEVDMCMNRSLSSSFSEINLKLSGKKNDQPTDEGSVSGSFSLSIDNGEPQNVTPDPGLDVDKVGGVQYTGTGFTIIFELASTEYYLYEAKLHTYNATNGTVPVCFILAPGEGATYDIEVTNADQYIIDMEKIYSAIHLVAVECDENGKPLDS